METTTCRALRPWQCLFAAAGLAASVVVSGCGGGDAAEDEPPPTVVVPGDGLVPGVAPPYGTGDGVDGYPVTAFSLPLLAQGTLSVGDQRQDYALDVVNERVACTIGMGALVGFEPPEALADVEALIAESATVGGAFATSADPSAGSSFAFWRLGDEGTENWSSYFQTTDERWSGTGRDAGVLAKFLAHYWVDNEGKTRALPILAIRVRWFGEGTENLTSRKASAMVEFECFFAPTGDELIARGVLDDPNDNEILDDDELAALRVFVLESKDAWLQF